MGHNPPASDPTLQRFRCLRMLADVGRCWREARKRGLSANQVNAASSLARPPIMTKPAFSITQTYQRECPSAAANSFLVRYSII